VSGSASCVPGSPGDADQREEILAYYTPLAYSLPVIFVETPPFERRREDYFDDEQFGMLQASLMACPDAGVLIRGSGGLRKLRWAAEGRGKRGGLRVIYYWISKRSHIYFLAVYRKSEATDLSEAEIKVLHSIVKQIDGAENGEDHGKA
jgi:mRNA-degrading endonuclease RelE of RelBE toxin-antitoxin system